MTIHARRMQAVAIVVLSLCATSLSAQELKLIPVPREVKRVDGAFTVGAKTKIVLGSAHAQEDRTAAETLAEEILSATGQKVSITSSKAMPKDQNVIYLARLGDDRSLRAAMEAKGLKLEAAQEEEGYLLLAEPGRVVVAAANGAGVFYGAQTLRQMVLRRENAWVIPAASIRDWPAMRWRGLHDDLSRGPVPTLEYMKKQIRTLAAFKLNLFSLYLEHIFDYQSHPIIAPKEDAITAADVKELVEYAKKYYVTILPEQQAFGHLHHALKIEKYADMAETPHGHVLAPVNEKSYEFIKSLYAELVPQFPGPLFHIGSDETWELGQGQTKAKAAEIGLGRVYLEHLKRVAEIMKPYNKRLLFWHDIALHYPDLLNILPKDMVPVVWRYDAAANFDSAIKPFKDAGFEFMVSPGANNWVHIYPDLATAFTNTRNLVRDGQKFGALGMLNTTWDDTGEMIFSMTWPAVVFGAAASWQPGESSIDAFKASYDWAFYRNDDSTFQEAIGQLLKSHELLRGVGLNFAGDRAFWLDPFSESGAQYTQRALPVARELRLSAERALEALYMHRAKARANADTLDALIFAALRLDALGMKIQFSAEASRFYWDAFLNQGDRARVANSFNQITGTNARLDDLRDATTRLRDSYARLWATENRPQWVANVLLRYDQMALSLQQKMMAVRAARAQYNEKGYLPSPVEMGFYMRPEEKK